MTDQGAGPAEAGAGPPRRRPRGARRRDTVPPSDFVVRIFTLADHATSPPDGKLYLAGAGIDIVRLREPDAPFPILYLVGRVAVPYARQSERHVVRVRLLDEDRVPFVHDPLFDFPAETGRPPGTRPGDEVCIQFVVGLHGLAHPPAGRLFFHLDVNDEHLATLPLRITVSPP